MVQGKARMLEIAPEIALKANAPHYDLGSGVADRGEADDLGYVQVGQAPGQGRGRALAGVAFAARNEEQSPADLARPDQRMTALARRLVQADRADHRRIRPAHQAQRWRTLAAEAARR
jgi:hypothetical protein